MRRSRVLDEVNLDEIRLDLLCNGQIGKINMSVLDVRV